MQVVESKVVKMLACTPEEADALKAEGQRVPTRRVGVRMTLDCGTKVFWSWKWRTFSVTYVPVVARYKSGTIITDEAGEPVWERERKNAAMGAGDLFKWYGVQFALLVIGAAAQVEREENAKRW